MFVITRGVLVERTTVKKRVFKVYFFDFSVSISLNEFPGFTQLGVLEETLFGVKKILRP